MLKVVKTVINHLLIYSLLVLYEIGVQSIYVPFVILVLLELIYKSNFS